MTHHKDGLQIGGAYYGRNILGSSNPAGRHDLGVQVHDESAVAVVVQLGAPATLDADGVVDGAYTTATAGGSFTLNGALVSTSVATFDVPRAVSITATADNSSVTFTISGTDKYGEALSEDIVGPTGTVNGQKAFLTVSGASSNLATTTAGDAINIGTADILGLPYLLDDLGKCAGHTENGLSVTGGTLVVGVTTAATATKGDTRGTIDPQTTMNGSTYVTLTMIVDASAKETLYGVDQA